MTGKLEKELIKATKFKPPKGGYKDRQDELAALARLGSKLPDDDFDDLSDEAGNWVNAAVKAIMAKGPIKDFIDDTGKASEDDAEEARDAEVAEDDTEQEPEDGDSGGEDDTEADAQAEADAESDNEAEEAAEAALPVKGKAVKFNKGGNPRKGGRPKADPEKVKKSIEKLATAEELKHVKTRYDDVTGEMDRYGVMINTKTHDAVLMYEKGTTSKGLTDKLGGRFYNILRKLSEQGHLVERSPEGVFTLTHRDDIKAKMAARKAEKEVPVKKGKKK